jgi:acetolactate synthase I/III small subunit
LSNKRVANSKTSYVTLPDLPSTPLLLLLLYQFAQQPIWGHFLCVFVQVPVWAVLDYTETRTISRELLLVKVSILGPEYLDDQLAGGPSHEPRASHRAHAEQTKLEREMTLARHFEESNRPHPPPTPSLSSSSTSPAVEGGKPLTPSEALRMRHQHLQSLHVLANQFGARIVDVSENSIILEMSGKTSRVEAFLSLVKPFGIIESARTGTFLRSSVSGVYAGQKERLVVYRICCADLSPFFVGLMAMPRTPIAGLLEEEAAGEGDVVDASLLPPG